MENILTLPQQNSGPVRKFLESCSEILFAPSRFFRNRFDSLSTQELLSLGILSGWLASFIGFFWESLNNFFFYALFQDWVQKVLLGDERLSLFEQDKSEFLLGAGFLVSYPFWAILRILASASILLVFTRLLVTPQPNSRPVTWSACLRILGAAMVGNWFLVVPVLGSVIAFIAVIVLTIAGVHEQFSVSYRRASLIVLLPRIMLIAMALFIVFVLGIMLLFELPTLLPALLG